MDAASKGRGGLRHSKTTASIWRQVRSSAVDDTEVIYRRGCSIDCAITTEEGYGPYRVLQRRCRASISQTKRIETCFPTRHGYAPSHHTVVPFSSRSTVDAAS